jgi:hypothetical protein
MTLVLVLLQVKDHRQGMADLEDPRQVFVSSQAPA